jgi:hypothetical protein
MDAPHSPPVAAARAPDPIEVVRPLLAVGGWMRFLGWLAIAAGGLQCLSCVGLLFGWIPIWIGVLLLRSVDKLERGARAQDVREMRAGVAALARAMQVKAALALVAIVLTLLFMAALVVLLAVPNVLGQLQPR